MAQATPSYTTSQINGTALAVVPALPSDALRSGQYRLEPVVNDAMSPDLRPGDFVLIRPIDRYDGPGLYLIGGDDLVSRELYSVEASFGRSATLRLTRANKHYSKISIDHDSFCERVLGKIVADVKVREFGPRP